MKLSFWKGKKHIGEQNTIFTYYSLLLQNVLIPRFVFKQRYVKWLF